MVNMESRACNLYKDEEKMDEKQHPQEPEITVGIQYKIRQSSPQTEPMNYAADNWP